MTDTETTAEEEAAPSEETQETVETVETEEEESTEETTEDTATEAEEDPEDAAEEEKPKKSGSTSKRIAKLTRERHNAERERDTFRQQLEALQATVQPAVAPKQEDFQTLEEFDAARIKFHAAATVRDELTTLSGNVQQQQRQAEQNARSAEWEVQVEDARDKYDDFDDVVLSDTNPVSDAMAVAFAETANGSDVAYHIASHPKMAREIAALSPTQAVLRIGKLSEKLGGAPASKQTKAPNPVKTVKSGSSSAKLTPYNAKNIDDYIKAREAQEKKSG